MDQKKTKKPNKDDSLCNKVSLGDKVPSRNVKDISVNVLPAYVERLEPAAPLSNIKNLNRQVL